LGGANLRSGGPLTAGRRESCHGPAVRDPPFVIRTPQGWLPDRWAAEDASCHGPAVRDPPRKVRACDGRGRRVSFRHDKARRAPSRCRHRSPVAPIGAGRGRTRRPFLAGLRRHLHRREKPGNLRLPIRSRDRRRRPTGLAAATENPSFLAVHPNGRFLYAVNETGNFQGKPAGSVTAFALERATGRLRPLNQTSTLGGGPCHLTVDRAGSP